MHNTAKQEINHPFFPAEGGNAEIAGMLILPPPVIEGSGLR